MLAPDPATPGLWTDPDWDGLSPATFAVVIGVSDYPHLDGGSDPATSARDWVKDGRKLGQLYVSALTARRVFDWMRHDYHMQDAPLRRCWLLLSPSTEELAHDPQIAEGSAPADMANCTRAIQDWAGTIEGAHYAVGDPARMVFFFSGHGVEVSRQDQMLLPMDYLGGDYPNYNAAISTSNLLIGTDSLPAAYRFFFVDACRNDYQSLRMLGARGTEILPPYPTNLNYRGAECQAVLYATSPAMRAWQPMSPDKGPTIFGQALLDGLEGMPDIQIKDQGGVRTVEFLELQAFMNRRMDAIIKTYDSSASQRAVPWGNYGSKQVVTELAAPSVAPPACDGAPFSRGITIDTGKVEYETDSWEAFPTTKRAQRNSALSKGVPGRPGTGTVRWFNPGTVPFRNLPRAPEFDVLPPIEPPDTPAAAPPELTELTDEEARGWAQDFSIGHRIFGHESVTDVMSRTLRVAALGRPDWLPPEKVAIRASRRIERAGADEALARFEIFLEIEDSLPDGYWLQLGEDPAAGVVLAHVPSAAPRFALDIAVDLDGTKVRRLAARPDPAEADSLLGEAVWLWGLYENVDILGAVSFFEESRLESILRQKHASPVAATIAANVLLRASRTDLMHDWSQNLAEIYSFIPDGAAIRAQHLYQDGAGAEEVAPWLEQLAHRGLPYTNDALGFAAGLFDRLGDAAAVGLEADAAQNYETARGLVTAARFFNRPDGLLASYAGFDVSHLAQADACADIAARALAPLAPDAPQERVALVNGTVLVHRAAP